MEITGKIIVALPEMSGQSRAGNAWKKREYVLETQETYPRKVHFDFFGDKADQFPLSVGDTVKLSFDIESREYNGRWYTSIRGWKAEKLDTMSQAAAPQDYPSMPEQPVAGSMPFPGGDTTDDLPF